MEKEYWENYYRSGEVVSRPSLFAEFVLRRYIKEGDSIIEFGCGNGRDSVYFASNNVIVLAVDQCREEITNLTKINSLNNLKFLYGDFTKLGNIGSFDFVYSRFTLHSVSEKGEDDVIKWSCSHIKSGGFFLIEARGQKNELYKLGIPVDGESDAFIYNNHYRRFIDINILQNKLISNDFEIILADENKGFAPFNGDDNFFLRVIAKKK